MRDTIDHTSLSALFDELFPICRSITGEGLRQSLAIFQRYLPLTIESVPSGSQVFDWIVPPEWAIRNATLTGPQGETIVDFKSCNLHVVNYSEPVDKDLSLDDLQKHLHSLSQIPNAIPYVTSYYKRTWGFCLTHEQRKSLKPGTYHASIDSELNPDGELNFAHCTLEGDSEREILLSSYLCHPSLANNELSGPLVLLGLYQRISQWKKRRFSYRFLLNPETIGSICFLHRYGNQLKHTLEAGLVLTCVGGSNPVLTYKRSRYGQSTIDRLMDTTNEQKSMNIDVRPFDPTGGSDERQFCSPGFNLPIGQFARDVYGQYEGYHNSLDTKEYMNIDQLINAIDTIEDVLKRSEISGKFINTKPFCEPQLGRVGLYPNINTQDKREHGNDEQTLTRDELRLIKFILNYSDGHYDMIDISKLAGCTLAELQSPINRLERVNLLRAQ